MRYSFSTHVPLDTLMVPCYHRVMKRLYLALPFGDAAGIGVEIILKALVRVHTPTIVIGDRHLIAQSGRDMNLELPFERVVDSLDQLKEAQAEHLTSILYHMDLIDRSTFAYGRIQAQCGRGAYESVRMAVSLIED